MNTAANTTVFLCEENTESILCAVYDAYAARLGHSHTKLAFRNRYEPELFAETRDSISSPEKAEKVGRSIRTKISPKAWQMVYRASLAPDPDRADAIYRFLIGGFYYGSPVTSMLTEPAVQRIFQLNRAVANEAHFYREFLRFDSLNDRLLFSRIRPKSHVLPLLTPHFCDRISGENFLIVDVDRMIAAVHPAQTDESRSTWDNGNWFLTPMTAEALDRLQVSPEDNFRDLWKTFYEAIAIEQRRNPTLQRNRMPLRYREFAPEFTDS